MLLLLLPPPPPPPLLLLLPPLLPPPLLVLVLVQVVLLGRQAGIYSSHHAPGQARSTLGRDPVDPQLIPLVEL